jgi:hypothetical protein
MERPMPRAVSITEFKEWLRRPEILQYTWAKPKFEGDDMAEDFRDLEGGKMGKTYAKYFNLELDTRDMKIYGITVTGAMEPFAVRDGNDEKETILEVIEKEFRRIDEQSNKDRKPSDEKQS